MRDIFSLLYLEMTVIIFIILLTSILYFKDNLSSFFWSFQLYDPVFCQTSISRIKNELSLLCGHCG